MVVVEIQIEEEWEFLLKHLFGFSFRGVAFCHLPLQEGDIFDNKLEFSEIKIAIGQGFR